MGYLSNLSGFFFGCSISLIIDAHVYNISNQLVPKIPYYYYIQLIFNYLGFIFWCFMRPENIIDDEDNKEVVDKARVIFVIANLILISAIITAMFIMFINLDTRYSVLTYIWNVLWGTLLGERDHWSPVAIFFTSITIYMSAFLLFVDRILSILIKKR